MPQPEKNGQLKAVDEKNNQKNATESTTDRDNNENDKDRNNCGSGGDATTNENMVGGSVQDGRQTARSAVLSQFEAMKIQATKDDRKHYRFFEELTEADLRAGRSGGFLIP